MINAFYIIIMFLFYRIVRSDVPLLSVFCFAHNFLHMVSPPLPIYRVSLVAQTVKNLPANWASHVAQWPRIYLLMQKMKEIWVQFLGQEDPLG